MPTVKFPYDQSGVAAAKKAASLHPQAQMMADSSPKQQAPGGRKKPKRSDQVPSGNKRY